MIGEILETKTPVSMYQPSTDVAALTALDKADYAIGYEILHRPWSELNDYSVIDRMNKDQRTFNSYVDESVDDPNEAWKWRGTRSMARNRAMAMHANLTMEYIIPGSFAQNDSQQEDREAGEVMSLIKEWLITNSNYKASFILVGMGMLVNPVTYLCAEYCNVYQTIREKVARGYVLKQVVDEVLSGFQAPVMSADQVLITNAHEQNIQRQRKIFKRKFIEYSEAEAKYGDHPNWPFIRKGIRAVYNEDDGLFYDIKQETNINLVEEATALDRRNDSEVCYINGIYMGAESVEWNPIRHRDNQNAPKYNLVPFGYERINEHFYFWKSMINRVGWDDQLNDAIYALQMNREILDLDPPVAYTGVEKVDTSVAFPGASIASPSENFKAQPIIQPGTGNGYRALESISRSMQEASISDTSTGNLPSAEQKATTVSIAAQNARIILNGVRKSLGDSVVQYGALLDDIAIQHLTVPEVDEITGGLSYRQFILGGKMTNGKKVSKRVRFNDELSGRPMTADQKKAYAMKNLKEVGYPDNKEVLYEVNPYIWSKLKYFTREEPEMLEPKTREMQRAVAERMYTLLRQDPLAEPEAIVRNLIHSYYRSDIEEYMAKNPQQVMGGGQPAMQMQPKPVANLNASQPLPALMPGINA